MQRIDVCKKLCSSRRFQITMSASGVLNIIFLRFLPNRPFNSKCVYLFILFFLLLLALTSAVVFSSFSKKKNLLFMAPHPNGVHCLACRVTRSARLTSLLVFYSESKQAWMDNMHQQITDEVFIKRKNETFLLCLCLFVSWWIYSVKQHTSMNSISLWFEKDVTWKGCFFFSPHSAEREDRHKIPQWKNAAMLEQ